MVNSFLNSSHFAFLKEYLGFIGICMGLVDIFAIVGRWSLEVCGPCCMWRLKRNFLFVIILSGVVRRLLPTNVWNGGPWWFILPVLFMVSSCRPFALWLVSPKNGEWAFMSAAIRVGLLWLRSLMISCTGRLILRGGL